MSLSVRFSSRSSSACFRLMHRSYQNPDPKIDTRSEHEEGRHSLPHQDGDMDATLEKDDRNGRGPVSSREIYDSDIFFLTQKRYLHAYGNGGDKYLNPMIGSCTPSYQMDAERKLETSKEEIEASYQLDSDRILETARKKIEALSLGGQRDTIEKCDHDFYNACSEGTLFLDCNSTGRSNGIVDSSDDGDNHDMRKGQVIKFHSPKELYVILDLNGVLIKRWDKNPFLPGIHKIRGKWIQLRPGCIEFLQRAFSFFRVGIWSTMTRANVNSVCSILEHQAHKALPFFMVWDKESCYQCHDIRRPDKVHVTADFKPLSLVWKRFPHLDFQNTVLVDDSPYKACINNPSNCIFPETFNGCTNDSFLTDVLCPYLEAMQKSCDVNSFVANNRLGQQPITVSHAFYNHLRPVMERCIF